MWWEKSSYYLKLPHFLQRLHLVFSMVKLTSTINNHILGRCSSFFLIIINKEEKWEVERILDNHWHHKRYQYLIKWKDFRLKANSWKNTTDMFTSDQVAECQDCWWWTLFYFPFSFYFTFLFLFFFLFLEQLGLGVISHAVTSVTT